MKKQTSSVNLTGKDIEVVLEALKELRGQMPFLVALSPQQRRQTPRVGLPHLATAENCLMAAREYPTLLPANFDLEQFADSVRVMVGLHKCWTALKELTSDVGDTLGSVGTETLKVSQQVRTLFNAAAKVTPGLKEVAQRLATPSSHAVGAESAALRAPAQPAAAPTQPSAPVAPPVPVPNEPTPTPPTEKAA